MKQFVISSSKEMQTGEKIEVVRKAPFGGPVAILVSSYVLTIRKEDAMKIDVKLLKDD